MLCKQLYANEALYNSSCITTWFGADRNLWSQEHILTPQRITTKYPSSLSTCLTFYPHLSYPFNHLPMYPRIHCKHSLSGTSRLILPSGIFSMCFECFGRVLFGSLPRLSVKSLQTAFDAIKQQQGLAWYDKVFPVFLQRLSLRLLSQTTSGDGKPHRP